MLRRKIEEKLLDWKKKRNKMPLIVKGARQTGKTTSIRKFAENNYKYIYELNFFENTQYMRIFSESLDVDSIISKLSLFFNPFKLEKGSTIIFLDEIQDCPQAITALKFLANDDRFDLIASGSLLGLNYKDVISFPVGYTETIEMIPLDFEEFLWAKGISESLIDSLEDAIINRRKIDSVIHDRLLSLFKEYIVVGGMPRVVETYIEQNNFSEVRSIQKAIIEDYKNDIIKYAESTEKTKARKCFLSIPMQLAKNNKKFQFSVVEKGGTSRKYSSSLMWLYDAGIINFCNNLSALRLPLAGFVEEDNFKVYLFDTGLLISMLDDDVPFLIIDGNLGLYKGAIYENIVAQMLIAIGKKLYYFKPTDKLEIDFILSAKEEILPIEVKSSDNTKSKSLQTLLAEEKYSVSRAIKLSTKNIRDNNQIISLPIYSVFLLQRVLHRI